MFTFSSIKPRKPIKDICHVEFFDKLIELISPSAIWSINVISKLNETCNEFPIPTVVYNPACKYSIRMLLYPL